MDWVTPLLKSWYQEPETVDEKEFTPWAESGWPAWNGMSPEKDVCDFVGILVAGLKPNVVIETGVGQGFTTRRIIANLGQATFFAFESDDEFRQGLLTVDLVKPYIEPERSPSPEDFAIADLTILDSDWPDRFQELEDWTKYAKPGSFIFTHDTGNGHHPATGHMQQRRLIEKLGINGIHLPNPRGSFLGWK